MMTHSDVAMSLFAFYVVIAYRLISEDTVVATFPRRFPTPLLLSHGSQHCRQLSWLVPLHNIGIARDSDVTVRAAAEMAANCWQKRC